jgi:hypothetical protein
MDESGPSYRRWHANCLSRIARCKDYRELSPSSSASFAVCLFGIFELLSGWWEIRFANLEQRNQNDVSLLQITAMGGNFAATQALIGLGADVNAQGGINYRTALVAASYRGQSAIVELLLSKGARKAQ